MTQASLPDAIRAPILLLAGWALSLMAWLIFAFYPAGRDLAWLAAAQAACFGTTDSGLPSAYGLSLLVAAPLSFLAGVLAAYHGELKQAPQWLRARLPRAALGLGLALALGGVLAWSGQRAWQAWQAEKAGFEPAMAGPLPADYPRLDRPLPAFKLVDQAGGWMSQRDLKGRVHFLTFAYAHCATVCPVLLSTTLAALKRSPGTGAVFLSLDPWRDKPSSLPSLARRWSLPAQARLLSGEVPAVQAALQAFKVPLNRDPLTGQIDHPATVYVVDARGRIAYGFNNPPVDWLVEAARRAGGP